MIKVAIFSFVSTPRIKRKISKKLFPSSPQGVTSVTSSQGLDSTQKLSHWTMSGCRFFSGNRIECEKFSTLLYIQYISCLISTSLHEFLFHLLIHLLFFYPFLAYISYSLTECLNNLDNPTTY